MLIDVFPIVGLQVRVFALSDSLSSFFELFSLVDKTLLLLELFQFELALLLCYLYFLSLGLFEFLDSSLLISLLFANIFVFFFGASVSVASVVRNSFSHNLIKLK